LDAPSTSLRAVFLGHTASPDAGIVELVDLGPAARATDRAGPPPSGFLLLSVMTDLSAALERLRALGLGATRATHRGVGRRHGGRPRPDGVLVELVDSSALGNLEQLQLQRS